ncbi:MAG: aspartate kinase [Bullifex sp.]|nr:aspartate kinase [Spirochaetales bacterium]MDY2816557.1 aspartate kinase [Bullifex sp.]MDD7009082.1 aspartate kinase [Spirochaetales bacterium]MDD7535626.1 aspartate kinase [Spirochaetales bacterium]MDY3849760.1 aspartate kinase [Bullifex sp.]
MVVCKFGGSSVADENQIKKVKAILDEDKNRKVAIVSAPGKRNKEDRKITDMLYECNSLVQQDRSCKRVFAEIGKRYLDIAAALKLDTKKLTLALDDVRRKIDAGSGTDYAASRGEYLSALLISEYLGWEFVDAADYIVINPDGTVNPISYERLATRLSTGSKYVIPGFYGASPEGVIKTFSRGGSDISGAIAARAVGAELYENWTDVSGMYSADPRVVENARVIPELTYVQVRELSDVGASVFHEEAIAPVIPVKIPINIKNTNRPQDPGTLISADADPRGLIGVSGKTGYSRLKLRKLMMFKKPGMRHALLTILHLYGVRPSYSLFGIDSIVWLFESKMATDTVLTSMCERLKKDFELDDVIFERGLSIIGIIGGHMDESEAFIDAVVALRDGGIHTNFVNFGVNRTTALIGVSEEDCTKAVQTIYEKVF